MARHGGAVGVDIGSAAIKIVELAGDGSGGNGNGGAARVAASIPTPEGAIEEGRITNVPAVGRALRELVQGAGIRTRRAVAAVNGQVALMREVRMPQLPAEEMRQAARFEVERYLPYPIAEVTFDTVVVGEQADGGATKTDVLVVAARTDVLKQHAGALQAAGLEPAVLEVEPLAVVRAVASRAAADQVTACIHLGSSVTMILVAEGEVPRVIRTVAFGTTQLLEAAASRVGADGETADGLRARIAAGGTGDGVPGLREALDDSLAPLVTEIRRSLEYYGGRYRAAAPARIVVTGGGAGLPGVTTSLTSALDVQVELGDPFADLGGLPQGAASQSAPAYAVAAGLARRGVVES
ncbi:MAG TPA: type IV pilus assembly protein PilM [bacterium]|nr:type IV pilus assembly protein PilM [bacterium]